jgi:DNA-binding response OmpR family regulator
MMGNSNTGNLGNIYDMISTRQQITLNELSDMAFSMGIPKETLRSALDELERMKVIAARTSGGVMTYYPLQQEGTVRKVLIVEDDRSINRLMALSIGKGFEIEQIYDGGDALPSVRKNRPDLVILDLMLPHIDGLSICKEIKSDPSVSSTIVIIISATDPITSRYKGLESGADFYIKKPFDPSDLRSLVTIFLKKRGKRFDPLIDLPDIDGISKEIEHSLGETDLYSIGTIKIASLGEYANRFGTDSAMVLLRLVSQLLQDIVRSNRSGMFVGFLDSSAFLIAGEKQNVESAMSDLKREFNAVLPFILQDEGYRTIGNIDSIFESKEVPRLSIVYEESEKYKIKERREEILQEKGKTPGDIGSYTYDEILKLFGKKDLDIRITRGQSGVKLQVSKDGDSTQKD